MFTLFHGTDVSFDKFTDRPTPKEDSVGNCSLGHWVTPDPSLAAMFGRITVKLQAPLSRVFRLGIRELTDLHHAGRYDMDGGHARHEDFAMDLVRQGYDFIAIIERDGECSMGIVLDGGSVDILERHASADIPEFNGHPVAIELPELEEITSFRMTG